MKEIPAYELSDECFEYDTFVNCLDSSVWFNNQGVQEEFEHWREQRG